MKIFCRMGERSLSADENRNTQILRVTWEIR